MAEHSDFARARCRDARYHPQQRRFPRTVRSYECGDPSNGKANRAVLKSPFMSVALSEGDGFEGWGVAHVAFVSLD